MAWAVLALLLVVAHVAVVQPLVDLYAARQATIDETQQLIARQSALVIRRPALEARRETVLSRDRKAADVIPARDATAVARLQEHLRDIAIKHGLRIDSLQVLDDRPALPLREIRVRAALSGSIVKVQRLLHGLETGVPMIRVSRLDLLGRPGSPDLEASLEIAALAESSDDVD